MKRILTKILLISSILSIIILDWKTVYADVYVSPAEYNTTFQLGNMLIIAIVFLLAISLICRVIGKNLDIPNLEEKSKKISKRLFLILLYSVLLFWAIIMITEYIGESFSDYFVGLLFIIGVIVSLICRLIKKVKISNSILIISYVLVLIMVIAPFLLFMMSEIEGIDNNVVYEIWNLVPYFFWEFYFY